MQIEDISEGNEEAYAATLPDYNNAVIMGKDMNELMEGVKAFLDYWPEKHKKKTKNLRRQATSK